MSIPTPSPPLVTPGRLPLSDREKAGTLADSLESLLQQTNGPLVPAVIDVVNKAMRIYSLAPASEAKLTTPAEDQDAIRGFKAGMAPGPNGVPNRALSLLLSAFSILLVLFNAIF